MHGLGKKIYKVFFSDPRKVYVSGQLTGALLNQRESMKRFACYRLIIDFFIEKDLHFVEQL